MTSRKYLITFPLSLVCLVALTPTLTCRGEYLPGIKWPEPAVVTPGKSVTNAPSDAIMLFDGTSLSESWELNSGQKFDAQKDQRKWHIDDDGAMVVGRGFVHTKQEFGDCQLHIEWASPAEVKGKSQGRGNSGIFFFGRYEIQVLDSYQNKTYFDGQAGAIYKQTPPMVNAMRPPGEWNVYDIVWRAPRFHEDGSLKQPAAMTAIHNGVLILNHFELQGNTPYDSPPAYVAHAAKGSIHLQDHGNPVRYRNIWIRELQPMVGERVAEPSFVDHKTGKKWLASEADSNGKPLKAE